MSINLSEINFSDLVSNGVNGSGQDSSEPVANESKFQKKKRKEPVIKVREDNLQELDPGVERQLSSLMKQIENSAENGELQIDTAQKELKDNQADNKAVQEHLETIIDLEIKEPIITKTLEQEKEQDAVDEQPPIKPKSRARPRPKASHTGHVDNQTDKMHEVKLEHDIPEDDAERSKKILVIHNYQNSKIFGLYLKQLGLHFSNEQLVKKNSKQLDKLITQIRVSCENKTNTQNLDHMLFAATNIVETQVSGRTKYNLNGWTEALKLDEGFLEAWELIKINRLSFARMSPEVKFVYHLSTNALMVVKMNELEQELKRRQANSLNTANTQDTTATAASNTVNQENNSEIDKLVYNGKL